MNYPEVPASNLVFGRRRRGGGVVVNTCSMGPHGTNTMHYSEAGNLSSVSGLLAVMGHGFICKKKLQ